MALPISTPEVDIATLIGTAIAQFTLGTNVVHGPVRPARDFPARAAFCFPSGGPAPDAILNDAQTKIRNAAVIIRIRESKNNTDPGAFESGLSLARSVRDTIHYAALTGYIDVRVNESEPIYLGEDEDGHPEFQLNVSLNIEE